jgi:hypothetical protein
MTGRGDQSLFPTGLLRRWTVPSEGSGLPGRIMSQTVARSESAMRRGICSASASSVHRPSSARTNRA